MGIASLHQKLELAWKGKDRRPRLEPRILLEDPARSYHAKHRLADGDLFDNRPSMRVKSLPTQRSKLCLYKLKMEL